MGTERVLPSIALASLVLAAVEVPAQTGDMPGAEDHPEVPRVNGTYIVGYDYREYDAGLFVDGFENRELQTESAEGIRTRIMYFGKPDMTPLLLLRNYQSAFGKLGDVEEKYSCRQNTCPSNFATAFIWADEHRIPTSLGDGAGWMYGISSYYRDQTYWYATVTADDRRFHVAVYSAIFSDANQVEDVRGIPSLHLEIVEVADFKEDLVAVTSEEITSAIRQDGHIALYGIYFDLDSASLRSESAAALTEIASSLQADEQLGLYVVGHTDNQGTLDYNQDLSERRAQSVVNALTSQHGIPPARLVAVGAGLIAPKASNDTEEGRALNRRVELVKR